MKTALLLTLAAALLFPAPAAQAAPAGTSRIVTVRVKKGGKEYQKFVLVKEGKRNTFTGDVNGQQLTFNTMVVRSPGADNFNLQYQVALEPPSGAGRSFSAQGEVDLPEGPGFTVIGCGPWSVSLAVESRKFYGETEAWKMGGDRNYRLTAGYAVTAGDRHYCSLVGRLEAQNNVTDTLLGQTKSGYILNELVTKESTGYHLQYQLEQGLTDPGNPTRREGELKLVPEKSSGVSGSGYKLTFLLETAPPAKKNPKKAAGKKDLSADGYGTVPIIQ